ncbi:hypothetical protein [Streptomyces sp. ISL-86]|uniref:hypothetical protein n=1 Tax=Streptomyces sp. ISL-86 TaxID=2819187 RepID=UPI00203526AD|nr:hypothetical protein [Streptomyces sp. ISL-86]
MDVHEHGAVLTSGQQRVHCFFDGRRDVEIDHVMELDDAHTPVVAVAGVHWVDRDKLRRWARAEPRCTSSSACPHAPARTGSSTPPDRQAPDHPTHLGGVLFDEDGSLDPLLKFLLYAVLALALAVGKMLWEWLTEDISRWITVDLWGLIADHPWWTGLIAASVLPVLLLLGKQPLVSMLPSPASRPVWRRYFHTGKYRVARSFCGSVEVRTDAASTGLVPTPRTSWTRSVRVRLR